jgi:hypothetical protein
MPQARADYLDGPGSQLNHAEIAEDCTAAADASVQLQSDTPFTIVDLSPSRLAI